MLAGRKGAKLLLIVTLGLLLTGVAAAESPAGPVADAAWLKLLASLTWPGAIAAAVIAFLYSQLGQAIGLRVRSSVVAPIVPIPVPAMPAVVADSFREVAQTVREVTGTLQTMAHSQADLAELLREMQMEQREATTQQRQVVAQQQTMVMQMQEVQVKLGEVVGRLAAQGGR